MTVNERIADAALLELGKEVEFKRTLARVLSKKLDEGAISQDDDEAAE